MQLVTKPNALAHYTGELAKLCSEQSAEALAFAALRTVVEQLVLQADRDPFVSVGHFVEHNACNARAALAAIAK